MMIVSPVRFPKDDSCILLCLTPNANPLAQINLTGECRKPHDVSSNTTMTKCRVLPRSPKSRSVLNYWNTIPQRSLGRRDVQLQPAHGRQASPHMRCSCTVRSSTQLWYPVRCKGVLLLPFLCPHARQVIHHPCAQALHMLFQLFKCRVCVWEREVNEWACACAMWKIDSHVWCFPSSLFRLDLPCLPSFLPLQYSSKPRIKK